MSEIHCDLNMLLRGYSSIRDKIKRSFNLQKHAVLYKKILTF